MKKAVLLITFNRLDTTQKVFEQIKKAKPPRLYIASDGPRENKVGEVEKIQKIRSWIVDNIDWECDVKTRFLEKNSGGCAYAIPAAVDWFFEFEEDGIILEDDCLPSDTFFLFCEELLDKYKDDKRIWHISGENPIVNQKTKYSYYFTNIMNCWGWASWKDRWTNFDINLVNYNPENVKKISSDIKVQYFFLMILVNILSGSHKTSWAYPWMFKIIEKDGLCINPTLNFISNIGILGEHYNGKNSSHFRKLYNIKSIVHPLKFQINRYYINKMFSQDKAIKKVLRKKYKINILGLKITISI